MMWETQCYIVANKHRIEQVAQLLVSRPSKGLKGQNQGTRVSSGTVGKMQDTQLHAAN